MFSFVRDCIEALSDGGPPTLFMLFFAYVWLVWSVKALAARRYRPSTAPVPQLATSVIVPVYNEPELIFRRVLASVVANRPTEIIAVVDGGDPSIAAVAAKYCDRVLRVPKAGKRAAIAAGLRVSDPGADIVIVLDSDTVWAATPLTRARIAQAPIGEPSAYHRVGGQPKWRFRWSSQAARVDASSGRSLLSRHER